MLTNTFCHKNSHDWLSGEGHAWGLSLILQQGKAGLNGEEMRGRAEAETGKSKGQSDERQVTHLEESAQDLEGWENRWQTQLFRPGETDGSVAKTIYYYSKSIHSQHTYECSQPYSTLVPQDRTPSSDLCRHKIFMWQTYVNTAWRKTLRCIKAK